MSYILGNITVVDNIILTESFDPDEFRVAVFQMHKDKSLGPNGFNPGCYKKFWDMIGPDLVRICICWLEKRQFFISLIDPMVVLIPKCDNPQTVKDLWSNSLCKLCTR